MSWDNERQGMDGVSINLLLFRGINFKWSFCGQTLQPWGRAVETRSDVPGKHIRYGNRGDRDDIICKSRWGFPLRYERDSRDFANSLRMVALTFSAMMIRWFSFASHFRSLFASCVITLRELEASHSDLYSVCWVLFCLSNRFEQKVTSYSTHRLSAQWVGKFSIKTSMFLHKL